MIYIASDTIFQLVGLKDTQTGDYLNDAAVSGKLLDLDGNELKTFSFVYVVGSDGDYQGKLVPTIPSPVRCGEEYQVEVTATHTGRTQVWREKHRAGYKGAW